MSSREFVRRIHEKAKEFHEIQDLRKIVDGVHNPFVHGKIWLHIDDVEGLLVDFVVVPKLEMNNISLEEWTDNIVREIIIRELKSYGIFENNMVIMIDKKQDKFVVVPKQKLQTMIDKLEFQKYKMSYKESRDLVDEFLEKFEELLGSKEEEEKIT